MELLAEARAPMWPGKQTVWKGRVATLGGLAAAVVPFAILVHLVAETMSLGFDVIGPAFLVRHAYLGMLFVLTAIWSARTVGVGLRAPERRRRCALIRAQLRGGTTGAGGLSLALTNVAFFGLSQLAEGVPIASGDWCLGLAAAIVGSILCALFVFLFGRSLIIVALVMLTIPRNRIVAPMRATAAPRRTSPRCAWLIFSLFIPDRPPPTPFLA